MTTTLRNSLAFQRLTRNGRCGGCGAIVPLYHGPPVTDWLPEALAMQICGVHTDGHDGRAWCCVKMEYTDVVDGWRGPIVHRN